MRTAEGTNGQDVHNCTGHEARQIRMTLSKLRHDIRNHLNAVKLSCALVRRRTTDELNRESLEDIDRAVDSINELVTRFMGDADAPSLLADHQPGEHKR